MKEPTGDVALPAVVGVRPAVAAGDEEDRAGPVLHAREDVICHGARGQEAAGVLEQRDDSAVVVAGRPSGAEGGAR